MIIGFDFDGTLVETWTATPIAGVAAQLARLSGNARTFVATNQAGPVFRAVLNDPKYPTVADVAQRIADGLAALDWRPDYLLVAVHPGKDGDAWVEAACQVRDALSSRLHALTGLNVAVSAHVGWRKPAGGMLGQVAYWESTTPDQICYIGDMDSDRAAAESVGARYVHAADWLTGGESTYRTS
jgi:hypothetical protein